MKRRDTFVRVCSVVAIAISLLTIVLKLTGR